MSRAKAYERRRRPLRILRLERFSPLRRFFGQGVELDPGIDPALLGAVHRDCELFLERWGVEPEWGRGMELKLRRLGQHRAEGVYYPEPPILVIDPRATASFAHEFGHHLDFSLSRARGGRGASLGPGASLEFRPYREAIVARMRAATQDRRCHPGRRTWWRYYTSPAECFARAFEQCTAELLPQPSAVVRGLERYRASPLFLPYVPGGLIDFFRRVLARPPAPGIQARDEPAAAACVNAPAPAAVTPA
jgi:hypothetical protein